MICDYYEIGQCNTSFKNMLKVSYNPKLNPYWTDSKGLDIDNKQFCLLQTISNKVYYDNSTNNKNSY